MARSEILVSLERHYALALGRYENAERAIEPVVGLKAVVAEDERIQAEKKKLKEKMERITYLIRVQIDPDWEPGHIRPVIPKVNKNRQGKIARAAYKVLKEAKEPLRVREIAHRVAIEMGLEKPDHLQINKLDSAIHGTLTNRLKDGMVVHDGGTPKRWSITRPDAAEQARAFASANSRPIL
jgi:hypothetical protein